jgi:hypothetical protein
MRLFALSCCAIAALAFVLGRGTSAAETSTDKRVITARSGDVIRVPAVETHCRVSAEAGEANLICHHAGRHRYEVYFYKRNLLVFRVGQLDRTAFSARGRP